jgi:hypothetical protein
MAPPRQGGPRVPYLVHPFVPPLLQHQDRLLVHPATSQPEPHTNLPFPTLAIVVAHGLGVRPPLGHGLDCD